MTGDRSISQPGSVEKEHNPQLNLLDIGATKSSITRVGDTEPVTKPTIPTGGEPTKPPELPPSKPPEQPPAKPPEQPPAKPPEKPPTEPTKPPEQPPAKPPEKPPTEPTKPPAKPPGEPTKPPEKPPGEPTQPPHPPERRREAAPVGYLELPDFAPRHHKEPPRTTEVPPTKIDIPPTKIDIPPTKIDVPPTKIDIPPIKVDIPPPKVDLPPVIPPVVRTPEPIPIKPIPLEPPHMPPLRPSEPHLPGHKPPTGVFTGSGDVGKNAAQVYANKFGSGHEMSAHHEHLIAPKIGLKVDVDAVGTGKDAGRHMHQTEMVTPKEHDHLGQWKYDVPGKMIIAGHVKYHGEPGPMFKLRELGVHDGVKDTVVIEGADGKRTTYEYAGRTILKDPHDQKTWDKVFAPGDPEHKQLTLVTCAGPVDRHGLHQWRLIVNLNEVKDKAAPASTSKHETERTGTAAAVRSDAAPKKEVEGSAATAAARNDAAPKKEVEGSATMAAARNDAAPKKEAEGSATTAAARNDAAPKKEVEGSATTTTARSDAAPKQDVQRSATTGTGQSDATAAQGAKADTSSGALPRVENATQQPVKEVAAPAKKDEPSAEPEAHPQPRVDVISNAGPGTHGPQTRFIYTHPLEKQGALTGITGELATTGDHLSYGQVGPNFSFLRDNDKYTLDSKIRLGYASGDHLFRSSNIPLQGLRGTTLSGQLVGTDRISDSTRLYAGGGAGYNFDQRLKQGFVEAGAQHLVNDKLVLRAGLQASVADHYGVGTYAVTGVQWRPNKNTSFGLDVDQPISGRSSKSPTVFLSGTLRF